MNSVYFGSLKSTTTTTVTTTHFGILDLCVDGPANWNLATGLTYAY